MTMQSACDGIGGLGETRRTVVLLVEEYVAVRRGIRLLIEADPEFWVCAGTASLADALAGDWDPDIVVHGLMLSDAAGAPIVRALRERYPRAGLVAFSRFTTPVYVHLALSAGDDGYVLKTAPPEDLMAGLGTVAHGGQWVQPELGAQLARWDEIPRRHNLESMWDLTRREQEVVELLALGHTNAEAADAMAISLRTVEAHRTHVMQKLGLRTRAEVVQYVLEHHRALAAS